MTDIRQSLQYADYLKREGWAVERIDSTNYFIRKLPLVGSVLKIQRAEKVDLEIVDNLVRKYRVFQIIIEPYSDSGTASVFDHSLLLHKGYKLSKSPYLPSITLQIDLTQSKEAILKGFKKDTRRAIKRGEILAIKDYSSPTDIKLWREAWKNSAKFDRYVPTVKQLINLRKSFPHNYSVFLASHNISGRVIGGALFTRSSHDFAYYWYGFTNSEGRSSLSQYSLLYQGILWGKRVGCKTFDFEGIYDPRFPNKGWLGFTHFKKSFGGRQVLYPGCFTKIRLPF